MVQVLENSYEDSRNMYSKIGKDKLIDMLIEANKQLDKLTPINITPQKTKITYIESLDFAIDISTITKFELFCEEPTIKKRLFRNKIENGKIEVILYTNSDTHEYMSHFTTMVEYDKKLDHIRCELKSLLVTN